MEILQFSTKVAALDKVFQYRSPTRLRPRLRPTDLAMSVNQLMEISPLMGVYHMLCCVCVSAFPPLHLSLHHLSLSHVCVFKCSHL